MRGTESIKWANIAATAAPTGTGNGQTSFPVAGGTYQLSTIAATYGTVNLQAMGADSSTLISLGSAITADGIATYTLAPGLYQLTVSGATALYAALTRVPSE